MYDSASFILVTRYVLYIYMNPLYRILISHYNDTTSNVVQYLQHFDIQYANKFASKYVD